MTLFKKEVEEMALALGFEYRCFGCGLDKHKISTIGRLDNGKGWRIKCSCQTTFDASARRGKTYNLCLLFGEHESFHYLSDLDRTFFYPSGAATIDDVLSMAGIIHWEKFKKIKSFM